MNRAKVFPLQIYYQSLDEAGESLEIIVKIFFFLHVHTERSHHILKRISTKNKRKDGLLIMKIVRWLLRGQNPGRGIACSE